MKNFAVFAVLISFLFAGTAFAADAKPVEKAVTGTFVSFTAGDAAKKTASVLVIKVGAKEESFVVDEKTVFTGKDKKAIVPTALKAAEKVEIKFTEDAKKVMTAVSVTLK